MICTPYFLVACERSGTTMFRLMLDHHPQIAFSSEFEYAVDMVPNQGWPSLERYYRFLESHRIFQDHGYTIDRSLDYPSLVNDFLSQLQTRTGKPIVGAAVHRHIDRLLRIWPEAQFIHLIRDGRDVARSCIGMGWASHIWTAADRWIETERLWDELRSHLEPDRFLEVHYEALIGEPEAILRRACEFFGVSYDPAMLDFPRDTTYEAPDPKLVYQWRKKMSPEDLSLIESRIGDLLISRGYELSGQPTTTVTPTMVRSFRRQDRLAGIRNRLKFLGPGLFLESYISRRTGPHPWRVRVQNRINQKERAILK